MADRCEAIIISVEEPATVEDLFMGLLEERTITRGEARERERERERERGGGWDLCA